MAGLFGIGDAVWESFIPALWQNESFLEDESDRDAAMSSEWWKQGDCECCVDDDFSDRSQAVASVGVRFSIWADGVALIPRRSQ